MSLVLFPVCLSKVSSKIYVNELILLKHLFTILLFENTINHKLINRQKNELFYKNFRKSINRLEKSHSKPNRHSLIEYLIK